jgi:predicted lipid-binding transport protein (Tim44 family)
MEGPPSFVSEDYADDVVYAPEAVYDAPVAYEPAPPPPPPVDPGASALGGAIVGGVLGGLLTGRASGAAAGAVVGGATGAIAGATAAARPGYYLAQDNCYYRYPSGQYVAVDPRSCY